MNISTDNDEDNCDDFFARVGAQVVKRKADIAEASLTPGKLNKLYTVCPLYTLTLTRTHVQSLQGWRTLSRTHPPPRL
jgi:hypothetical protein